MSPISLTLFSGDLEEASDDTMMAFYSVDNKPAMKGERDGGGGSGKQEG